MEKLDKRFIPSSIKKKFEEGFLYLNATGKRTAGFDMTQEEFRLLRWLIRINEQGSKNGVV